MEIPGFDPKVFTDQQLLDKETELHRRIGYAARFSSGEVVQQFQMMLSIIETERRERLVSQVWQARQKMFPDVIESDPDMVEKKDNETETQDNVRSNRKVGRERTIMEKSSSPTMSTIKHNK